MLEYWALLAAVVLFHTTTFFAARSWCDSGSSRLAHVVTACLLILWLWLSTLTPSYTFDPSPLEPGPRLQTLAAWIFVGAVVLALARLVGDQPAEDGAHGRALLGWGTPLAAVGLLISGPLLAFLYASGTIDLSGPSSEFLQGLSAASLFAGGTLGLVCSYAGMIEVRRRNPTPGWGPISALYFFGVALLSLVAVFGAIEGLLQQL